MREGFVTRSHLSRPTDDKWSIFPAIVPPTVEAIIDGNQKDMISWTVEEHGRNVGEHQYDHCIIRSIDCLWTSKSDSNILIHSIGIISQLPLEGRGHIGAKCLEMHSTISFTSLSSVASR